MMENMQNKLQDLAHIFKNAKMPNLQEYLKLYKTWFKKL